MIIMPLNSFTSKVLYILLFVVPFAICLSTVISVNITDLPSVAYLSSTWRYEYGSSGMPFLFRDLGDSKPSLLAEFFFCCGYESGSFFSIALASKGPNGSFYFENVVWTANRNHPVDLGSQLELTVEGDLVLRDFDGTLAWSSNTSGKSVAGLNLTENGNLILFDDNKSVVWQSFDHPTDTLLFGQKLFPWQKLRSLDDLYAYQMPGLHYTLSITDENILATAESDSGPPEPYYNSSFNHGGYIELGNGSVVSSYDDIVWGILATDVANSTRYVKLSSDGYLKVYQYQVGKIEQEVFDLLALSQCKYPMACGRYGICNNNDQCICPSTTSGLTSTSYFQPTDDGKGCSLITSVTCDAPESHDLVELEHVTYFSLRSAMEGTTLAYCKEACLANCSCKVAIYSDGGGCLLSSEVFSLMETPRTENVTAFIRVQKHAPKNHTSRIVTGISVGGFFIFAILIAGTYLMVRKRQKDMKIQNDLNLEEVGGTLSRFSSHELKIATKNFSNKLGQGGFGSVYEGVLRDGTKIAVKRLHRIEQSKRSFLAEVESIGSIHHVNLIKLIGFCIDKLHNHLVYEFMTNGSLDRWIYSKNSAFVLDWKCKKNIIQDVAKGLAYLHEGCRQKIVHLDVKPQNILLNGSFHAKISDFGLAKLIDKSQSKVVTMVRGTPGYLSPEWLNGVVTEKVDVYSFGIVLLEILCGRKHFEVSEDEEHQHLVSLVKRKVEEGQLSELVDNRGDDAQSHVNEAIEMIELAVRCLQTDRSKRPSMSTIVKLLEGAAVVEENVGRTLLGSETIGGHRGRGAESAPLSSSVLTGPR